MSRARQAVPNLVYVIAGGGYDANYLKKLAEDSRVTIFLGKIEEEEKSAWLNISHIFVTISREIEGDYEGFGIVYLEANLAGKPVIAGDSGGVRDAVKDGINGLLVNPEKDEEISQAIINLGLNKYLREKLGAQGRARAIKEFSWEKQAKLIWQILS